MPLHADLIVTNARLMTLDRARPDAAALAVRRGVIECVGSDAEVLALAGPQTTRIDAQGKTIVPGFHDCHLHLLWFGVQLLTQADLVGTASIDDVLARLSQQATRCDGWIRGHGFDQDKLAERRFPTRDDLDRVSWDRPIVVSRVCGHACVVNSAMLALLSESERAAGDAHAGLYTEDAAFAIYAKAPPPDAATSDRALLAAMDVALQTGITSLQTMLESPEQLQVYQRLKRQLGRLPVRVVAMPPERSVEALSQHGLFTGVGDDWLRIGAAKFFSDGSLGARTALLAEPYADDPRAIGQRLYDPEQFKQRARSVTRAGFHLCIHAIGDQALRESLDAIEFALDGDVNTCWRHRIEHASVCPPDLLDRMARLHVPATLQPQFVTSDTWTGERLGPARRAWGYPFRSMLEAGVPCGLSSDCPVEKLDAFACLSSAVNRHPWSSHETLTVEQAIDAYCRGSAYCGHRETLVGTLAPGFAADFVVLSDDPRQVASSELGALRAERVFIAGQPADTGSPVASSGV